ncbi:hypothetical protein PAPYR_12318 [Paratrimastix pyriformis]|uniref:Uncharacterized protein n=1 Tax=Paratrimastix pyriformis TaxID=342808 RepID=A0ABQ8U225_9EUKA|nr:hypothetical protein PAPYR_12318 [Paratrimastix pyriformis]
MFVGVLKSIPAMNSIDWNQFHTPKPLSIARVRSARTPEMGRGLPGDQLVSRPAATHRTRSAPAPTPTAPKAPTALTARPTTPASGAVEHKDKGTGAARPILDDDDVPSPPKPKRRPRRPPSPEGSRGPEEAKAAPVAANGDLLLVVGRGRPYPEPKAKAERKRASRPTRTTSPRRPLAKYCTSPGLAYERLGAIVEWFEKLGAAVLFSIIVQTSALDEARYQVVDGSHRFQVARIIVDPRRGGEAQQATPQIRQHLKEDYIDVAVYNTLDPEAMLDCNVEVNLLTHDARFGSSTFDVLLNLKRASLQAPKRYIREDPDFATHLEPALKELHFPKGEDAPAKLVKILECFSLEMLCPLPAPGQGCGDESVARAMLEGRSVVLRPPLQRPISRSPFGRPSRPSCCSRPTMQLRWPPETTPVLYLPPTRPPGRSCGAISSGPRPCLHELPQRAALPIPQGQGSTPGLLEELGELGCPFERLNETDVGNMPQEITFMDGRRLSEFELVLGYWLGWCAAQLPPAMQDYLMPEHCPYARLWEEMGHHDIPVPASAC